MSKGNVVKVSVDGERMPKGNILAVTNRHLCTRPFTEQMKRVCEFRPRAILLREKDLSEKDYTILAQEVMEICQAYDVPLIFHTYPETARKLEGTAIHLPLPLLKEYTDSPASTMRTQSVLSGFTHIGTSVHYVEEALEAEQLGATYLTAGHIYTTDCKKGIPPRGLEFLQNVCHSVSLPVYAIGGIKLNASQFAEINACGAKGGCIMSGMMTL